MSSPVKWPSTLVVELAEQRCIPFLGAGASSGCTSTSTPGRTPPDWSRFLTDATRCLRDAADRPTVIDLIAKGQFLDAAQVLVDESASADFEQYIKDCFKTPRFQASALHEAVLELDPKIVITTNYDDIYESFCTTGKASEGYYVCRYYEDHAINHIRSDARLILKAHGCVQDPSKIVLSRSQYFEAKREHPGFYAILDSLFLTNTLLFLGCGLADPDIQLVLENANIAAPSTHPHYALVPAGRHRAIKQSILRTYNIELLEYPAGDHAQAVSALRELRDDVLAERAP